MTADFATPAQEPCEHCYDVVDNVNWTLIQVTLELLLRMAKAQDNLQDQQQP